MYKIIDIHTLFGCFVLILWPCEFWFLYKSRIVQSNILNPHPTNSIYLFFIYLCSFLLSNTSGNKKVRNTAMCLKLNTYFRIYSMMYVYSCLLLHFSSSTSLCCFMLIPLPLWKSKFISNLDHKNFCILSVEYNCATYRLIFL